MAWIAVGALVIETADAEPSIVGRLVKLAHSVMDQDDGSTKAALDKDSFRGHTWSSPQQGYAMPHRR